MNYEHMNRTWILNFDLDVKNKLIVRSWSFCEDVPFVV